MGRFGGECREEEVDGDGEDLRTEYAFGAGFHAGGEGVGEYGSWCEPILCREEMWVFRLPVAGEERRAGISK